MTQNKLHTRIASAFLFVLACVTSTIAADKLSIGYLSSTGQGKFFIAKDAGIFKKNGLDVELVEFSNSGDGIAAVRAGKLDAGAFGSLAPLIHVSQGADIRVIGGLMGGDQAVITRKENAGSVKKLSDLKGKKIATIRLGTADAIVRGGLKKEGIDWRKDVQCVCRRYMGTARPPCRRSGSLRGAPQQGHQSRSYLLPPHCIAPQT